MHLNTWVCACMCAYAIAWACVCVCVQSCMNWYMKKVIMRNFQQKTSKLLHIMYFCIHTFVPANTLLACALFIQSNKLHVIHTTLHYILSGTTLNDKIISRIKSHQSLLLTQQPPPPTTPNPPTHKIHYRRFQRYKGLREQWSERKKRKRYGGVKR